MLKYLLLHLNMKIDRRNIILREMKDNLYFLKSFLNSFCNDVLILYKILINIIFGN